jgi:hypothetical protein
MKLYTKEMFLIAAEKCEVSMIDANHIMKYIDEYVTPIELPSYDKITRFEVIDHSDKMRGRYVVEYGVKVEVSIQDEGRTMKVFLTNQIK